MKMKKTVVAGALSFALFVFVLQPSAYAYLDPGSGSYFFQILIAFFLGALFSIKVFWMKIAGFFKGLFSKKKPTD